MKKPGCCTLCETEVYEIKTYWTHPYLNRMPQRIGKPKANARPVDYLLSDGSYTTITFCEDCLSKALNPVQFPRIWRIVLAAFARELDPLYLKALNAPVRTEKQERHARTFVDGMTRTAILSSIGGPLNG